MTNKNSSTQQIFPGTILYTRDAGVTEKDTVLVLWELTFQWKETGNIQVNK